jgi:hypothetical protein
MTKNLDVEKFNNGDPIPHVKTEEDWKKAGENKQPAWCYYDNDQGNGTKYGKLYNWYAVNDPRGLAPVGFHIPTNYEWEILINYLGGEYQAGKKMKSKSGWRSKNNGGAKICPNCSSWNAEYRSKVPCHICKDTRYVPTPPMTVYGNGDNSSGFLGLPGGFRLGIGMFYGIGNNGGWWSSTEFRSLTARFHILRSQSGSVVSDDDGKSVGLSVRCLRN